MTGDTRSGAAGFVLAGLLAAGMLVGGIGWWSSRTSIASAVVTSGTLQVESRHYPVQAPLQAVLSEVRYRDGQRVAAGDLIFRLDGERQQTQLDAVEWKLAEYHARLTRLRSEFDEVPLDWSEMPSGFPDLVDAEARLFRTRLDAFESTRSKITETIRQLGTRIEGTGAQLAALTEQLDLTREELETQLALQAKGLSSGNRMHELKSQRAALSGQIGSAEAEIAQLKGQVASAELELQATVTQRKEEALTEMRRLQYAMIDLERERRDLAEAIAMTEVRAPVSGVLFDSRVHTIGTLVQTGQLLTTLVPDETSVVINTRVPPSRIDEVHVGQAATVAFGSLGGSDARKISATVEAISIDLVDSDDGSAPGYHVEIRPDEVELTSLGTGLRSGMPAEIFITAEERTVLSYLVEPLSESLARSLR